MLAGSQATFIDVKRYTRIKRRLHKPIQAGTGLATTQCHAKITRAAGVTDRKGFRQARLAVMFPVGKVCEKLSMAKPRCFAMTHAIMI